MAAPKTKNPEHSSVALIWNDTSKLYEAWTGEISIDTGSIATESTLQSVLSQLENLHVTVDNEIDVSIASLPDEITDNITTIKDTLITIDTDTGVIAGDTTSIDGKTPALGTAAMAASSPVTIASDDTLITAIKNALEIMDDWDESDRAKVNLIVGQAGIAGGSGTIDATTTRVTIATDDGVTTTLGAIASNTSPMSGTGSTGTLALAVADTWYQCPPSGSVPSQSYVLVVSKENEGGTIRWGFANGSTPSATFGSQLTSKDIVFDLGGNQVVYIASSNAGDDVNWNAKIL